MMGTLEKLLERIRDGVASDEEVAEARELVVHDARLPEDLREIGLTDVDDLPGDAVGLLAVLGAAPLFDDELREALSDEASAALAEAPAADDEDFDDAAWEEVATVLREELVAIGDSFEIASSVMARLPAPEWAYGPVTAEAVRGEAGTVDVAGAAMADLGDALPPVAEAVAAEAGTLDVVAAVLAELSLEAALPVADAVAVEAGTVDVVAAVWSELEFVSGPAVADAVAAEAGAVDVVASVLAELSLDVGVSVGEAVHAEAGHVDIADAVMASLTDTAAPPVAEAVAAEAGEVEVADEVLGTVTPPTALPAPPSVLEQAPPTPVPANRTWTWGAIAMAAVALLMVGLSQFPGLGDAEPQGLDIEFASAGELVVEDLDYADDVTVMQAEGDEGAVILWMEDV